MTYANIAKYRWSNLGVYTRHQEVLKLMNEKQIVCAKSGTGSGKTVIFPKFALHVGGYKKKVLCAIPKKQPTKTSAEWAATTMDVRLGEEVGFFYKGNHNRSNKTLLTFTTTGSVNAIIKRDPLLSDYDYLVIDEAHERKTDMDLLMLFVKELVVKRKDMKVVIMSATIDPEHYRQYFSGVPNYTFSFGAIDIPAEAPYPRMIEYAKQDVRRGESNAVIEENIVRIISQILDNPPLKHDKRLIESIHQELKAKRQSVDIFDGDILAFVTSGNSAKKIITKLHDISHKKKWPPFYATKLDARSSYEKIRDKKNRFVYLPNGDKVATEEDFAKDKDAYKIHHPLNDEKHPFTRKIVIATDVAESSITIDGVTYVVDSGITLDSAYHPQSMCESLLPIYVARDAIEQRQGRVGRSNPGVCYHLYTEDKYDSLDSITIPDIRKTDLTANVLEIMSMDGKDSVGAVRRFFNQLMEPPKEEFIASALRTLHALGAITSTDEHGRRNIFGRAMSYFRSPITPVQAKCLIISKYHDCSHEMAELVALLDACEGKLSDFIVARPSKKGQRPQKRVHPHLISKYGDHLTMLHMYDRYKKAKTKSQFCKKYWLNERKFMAVEEQSKKIWNNLDTLFEREDDLTEVDASLILNEMNLVETTGIKNAKTRTNHRRKKKGGTFVLSDDLTVKTLNTTGAKDIEIVYALYPHCKRNIKDIVNTIQRQDDPAVALEGIDADKAQQLLISRIQRYNTTAFSALTSPEQKHVLVALNTAIQYRESEQNRIGKANHDGKATVAELADAKGHDAWLSHLKTFRVHASRKYRQETYKIRQETKQRVKEKLYKHIENIPENASEWDNWEERLLRVMYEGYYVQSAVRLDPNDNKYHTVFPFVCTQATLDQDAVLSLPMLRPCRNDVILYEQIFTGSMGTTFQCVSTLPSRVRKNKEVVNILTAMTQSKFKLSPPHSRRSTRHSKLFRSGNPITLGRPPQKQKTQKQTRSKRKPKQPRHRSTTKHTITTAHHQHHHSEKQRSKHTLNNPHTSHNKTITRQQHASSLALAASSHHRRVHRSRKRKHK